MKNFTKSAVLLLSLSITGILGCKKLKTTEPNNNAKNVNPVTATAVCDYDFNDATLTTNGWTKVFDDEFTGDLSNWYAYTGGVRNEEQYYQPANAQTVDGVLQLKVNKESITAASANNPGGQQTYNFTSASIVSNATFAASSATPKVRFVARVKIASGYGLVSLFESYGASPWPTNGQINFFQVEGNDVKEYATNYFYGTQENQNMVTNGFYFNPVNEDLSTCWHLFETEWTQSSLNFYLDGKLVETKAGGSISSLFGKLQNISLSVPIGGLYYENLVPANIQTGTMYVDYVKVFTSK